MKRWLFIIGTGFFLLINVAMETAGHAQEEMKRITVQLSEYRFEPSRIELSVGQETELVLVNNGKTMHEFITEALQTLTVEVEVQGVITETLGVAELEIPMDGKVTLRFTPEKPGEFLIACRAREPKDHFKEGMEGRLLIR